MVNEIIGASLYDADTLMGAPRIPDKNQGMNGAIYDRWAGAYGKPFSKALASMKKKITHVSHQAFEETVRGTVGQFMNNRPEQYVALVEPGKSQKWVTEIALQNGLAPAAAYVAIGEEGANTLEYALNDVAADDNRFKHYVIVDDASYTGNQMANNISAANRIFCEKFPEVTPVFHVLIPNATIAAIEKIGSLRDKGVDVNIYNSVIMPTIAQAIEKSYYKTILDVLWPGMDPKMQQKRAATTALHWFDHKIPNSMSFPDVLARGRVLQTRGQVPDLPFLPRIHPPYKPPIDGKENILDE